VPTPRLLVPPPLYTPPAYGLLSVVDFPPTDDAHWQNGVEYQPYCADPSSTYDECIAVTGGGGAPPPPVTATIMVNTVDTTVRAATPFSVFVEYDCSTVGNDEALAISRAAFLSVEGFQAERSFWTGLAANQQVVFPHLAANSQINIDAGVGPAGGTILLQDQAVIVTGLGDRLNASQALGLLEEALGNCYNGQGIIHIPAVAAPTFDGQNLIHKQGSRYYTAQGNKVALGYGYTGSSPAGAARAKDTAWVYATGNVNCWRGPVTDRSDPTQALDKVKNTRKMITERRYVLGWDCCHFAVQVGLGQPQGT
jgi:hypothetical protein